jgi:ribosomal protein S18 acetylase RimI-like enzyme
MENKAAAIIRSAEPRDFSALLRMKSALQREDGGEHAFVVNRDLWLHQMFGREKQFDALVAEADNFVFGMLIYSVRHYSGWPSPAISLQDLFVEPSFRRNGAGLLLLRQLAQRASTLQAEHIELVVRADNPARSFYENAGFLGVAEAITYIAGHAAIETLANSSK